MNTTLPESEVFPPRFPRILLATLFIVLICVQAGSRMPVLLAILILVPGLGLMLVLAYFLIPGLILSAEGIEWYVLRPGWRFRRVPWQAVVGVRKPWWGPGVVLLEVERRRYEIWIWGRERPDEQYEIGIWLVGLKRGNELFRVIQARWSARQGTARTSSHGPGGPAGSA